MKVSQHQYEQRRTRAVPDIYNFSTNATSEHFPCSLVIRKELIVTEAQSAKLFPPTAEIKSFSRCFRYLNDRKSPFFVCLQPKMLQTSRKKKFHDSDHLPASEYQMKCKIR